jgi:hypothetical protein
MNWKRCRWKRSRPNCFAIPEFAWQDGGTLLNTSGQPMASKYSNQTSPGYKSRPVAPHQSFPCWAGFIKSASEHFQQRAHRCIYVFHRLLWINNIWKAPFLWDMTLLQLSMRPRSFVYELWNLEVEGTVFLRNVGMRLPTDAASYPRIPESSATPTGKRLLFSWRALRLWSWRSRGDTLTRLSARDFIKIELEMHMQCVARNWIFQCYVCQCEGSSV